jgi:NRE family putative nickel resistance protein-like MFS transporter
MSVKKIFHSLAAPFRTLKNLLFAKLYLAETISLLGDAFTWVGLALLTFQFGKDHSAIILASALTLRVTAFIIFSPFAGVLADKIDKKKILYITHFIRMAIVMCFPFVNAEWQIYVLVFFLNIFNAFFTPTYRSVIPHIVSKDDYRQAIGLSNATYQLLGVLGPGLAGILAVWLGARQIFFVDAASFIVAGVLILLIPGKFIRIVKPSEKKIKTLSTWQDVIKGARLLFGNRYIRFSLVIEFISAIAGAQILVSTVGHIKMGLQLNDKYYGLVMSAFAVGAAITAFLSGSIDKSKSRELSLICGALVLALALIFANFVAYPVLLVLWCLAGLGQSLAEIPSETLIGENIKDIDQGKVYGSHFAFSHLWWFIAYPVAGYIGQYYPQRNFMYGGSMTLFFLLIAFLFFRPKKSTTHD